MASARACPLIVFVCFGLWSVTPRLAGSGGWFDVGPAPTLAGDLDRLPAKTLGEILLETTEKGELEIATVTETDAVGGDEIKKVVGRIGDATAEGILARLDGMVARARLVYVPRGGVLNRLHDLRDAVMAKGPTNEQRKRYCEMRLAGQIKLEPDAKPETYAVGDPMRAHLLVFQGAALFAARKRIEARPWFEEVLKKFPDHPRAETAAFLAARCALWAAKSDEVNAEQPERIKSQDEAVQMFQDLVKKYPKGIYVADAHGWLGALLWEDRPAEALVHYIAQLEDAAHPECRKSAAHMVERVLATVLGHPDENEAVFKVVAQHPRVAQAAVYLVLNAPEIDPNDGKYDEAADLKKWKQHVLPELAVAVSAEEKRYAGAWALRMRAMLAQAASSVGKQEEALKLTEVPETELKKSDDLLWARLLVLQRMKKPREAAKVGKVFLELFGDSQLRKGVVIRLAQALLDDHRSGEAYVYLHQEAAPGSGYYGRGGETPYPEEESKMDLKASAVYPDTDGGDAYEGLKKTILDFAPLKELEVVLDHPLWKEKDKAEPAAALKKFLFLRKESAEDFAGAMKLTQDGDALERLEHFEELWQAIKKTEGRAKAQAMMALGNAYEELAQKKTHDNEVRGETNEWGYGDDLDRREHARALGYHDPDAELENRNPLRHATRWWLRAARLVPRTELSAQARFKVLDGIERTARTSDYNLTRAMETHMDQASKEIYDILHKEHPDAPETRDAAYWNFTPCPKPKPREGEDFYVQRYSLRGAEDYHREINAASLLGGYGALPYDAFGEFHALWETDEGAEEGMTPYLKEMQEVAVNPVDLPRQFSAAKVTEGFNQTRTTAENAEQMKIVNLFEDLMLFHQVPGLTDDARNEYIRLRLRADEFPSFPRWPNKPDPRPTLKALLEHARANPALAAVGDFVDYVELYANEADRGPNGSVFPVYPTYATVEKGCREFLEKYPKSPRREACHLLLMRAIYRQLPERFGHPEKKEGGVEESVIVESDEPFRAEKLIQAITDYGKEFPKMRYEAEVRNFLGIIAWRQMDYGTSLDLTMTQLDDMTHPDLRREAAVRLASIFADLRDPRHRQQVLGALSVRPGALLRLKAYLDIAPLYADHPLRYLRKFLGDRLGFQFQ